MSKTNTQQTGRAESPAQLHGTCNPEPKWATKIDDQVVPAPRRRVKVKVLREQANIKAENVLVRDLGGEHDIPLQDEQIVDLAEGNVFYVVPECEAPKNSSHLAPPKLAFFVDDRAEETLRGDQNGSTLRDLFGLTSEVQLFRDFESPDDQSVSLHDPANFADGPVFYTRRRHTKLTIFVNDKPFTEAEGVKHQMTGAEIAKLVFDDPTQYDVFKLPSDEEVQPNQKIKIHCDDRFKVIRKTVKGGYEITRLERELNMLRHGGARVTFIAELPAVVFHDIPTRKGYPYLRTTDVLVPVPSGFPGQPIDGAYLPQGSPLFGRVVGSPQARTLHALNQTWQLVSYHPYAGGGAPPWNKDRHGFHTYIDELLTWVHHANA